MSKTCKRRVATHKVTLHVELYGLPRLLAGRKLVPLEVPTYTTLYELVTAIAEVHPELIGPVVQENLCSLQESYILNLNGERFLSSDEDILFQEDDIILVIPSNAGG